MSDPETPSKIQNLSTWNFEIGYSLRLDCMDEKPTILPNKHNMEVMMNKINEVIDQVNVLIKVWNDKDK